MEIATRTRAASRQRYVRKKKPDTIEVTPRDLEIVRTVARLRFVSSLQLWRLVGGSKQKILRRLGALYDNGYLDRPRAQIAQLYRAGNHALVYGLGRAGAKLIAAHDGIPLNRLDWTTKNTRAGAVFIAHTIETAEIMIAIALAARERGLRLIDHAELLPYMPEKTRAARNPFAWRTKVKEGVKDIPISLIPDRLFSLVFPDNTRLNFVLEIDRGQMPVTRASFEKQTSYARKLAGYWNGWQEKRHQTTWGFTQLFVLTVTTSEDRIASMIEVQRRLTGAGSRLFLFSTQSRVAESGPFTDLWIDGKGHCTSLVA